jgi:hypothetical protein
LDPKKHFKIKRQRSKKAKKLIGSVKQGKVVLVLTK